MRNAIFPTQPDAKQADEFFGNPALVEAALSGAVDAAITASNNVDHPEQSESKNAVPARTHNIVSRTIAALKKALGIGQPRTRNRDFAYAFAGGENLEARRLMSATPAEVRYIDSQGTYTLQQETLTEAKKIDLSTLQQGVHPEMWTTNIDGIGHVTMWFEGGTKVDSHGISAVNQPMGGTGWFIRFDDGPVKVLSTELDFSGTSPQGYLHVQANGDYVRENGQVKAFALTNTVDLGGRTISLLDEGQNNGLVDVKSLTVETTVTHDVKHYITPDSTPNSNPPVQMETVKVPKTIDLSTLEHGTHPEMWATTIDGIGHVTMYFQGGVKVDEHGISAVSQPLGGTGWFIRFDDAPVKAFSVGLESDATTDGWIRVQSDGDYVHENGQVKNFAFSGSVDLGGRTISLIDAGQRDGTMSVKSLTVEATVTRPVSPGSGNPGISPEAVPDTSEMVLAPVSVSFVGIPGSAAQGIKLTAPFDVSYLKTTNYGVIKTEHPGGANNLMIFNNYLTNMMDNDYGSKTVVWTVYADQALTIPFEEITFVGNRMGISMLSAVALPVHKDLLPAGQEYEKVPELHIAHLEGPNAILEVSSPIENSTVEFVGVHDDSILGRATIIKNPDGGMTPVSVMMNPANPTGDYNLLMKGTDERAFGRILVHWDQATKQLSLPSGQTAWTAPDSLQSGLDAAIAGLHQSMVDINTTDRNLSAIQQEILLTAASSMPGMQQDFDTAFFATHPEWRAEARANMNATALQQFNDTYGILREDYGKFQGMLGDLLKQGSALLCQIRNGGNETNLRAQFAVTVDSYATSLPMAQLASIGIHMPTGTQILAGAKCACDCALDQLMTVKNSTVIQQMNQQAFANNGLVVNSDGTYMVSNDPRLQTTKYYVDAGGRLSLLNPDGTRILVGNANTSPDIHAADVIDNNGHIDLGTKSEIHIQNLSLEMQPGSYKVITFTLSQTSMVNLDAPGVTDHDLSLTLQAINLPAGGYTSNKARSAGESISLKLAPGTYTLTLQDKTDYNGSEFGYAVPRQPFSAKIDVSAVQFTSANIVGSISIEGSEKVMPVSMRVAEFVSDPNGNTQRNTNYDGADTTVKTIDKLNPTKPVWVVVHGRTNSEDSSQIAELTKNLRSLGVQVVTIDWHDAAKDNLTSVGLEGSKWIEAVGTWTAETLKMAGFTGANINVIGHSWGSYVSYEIGKHTPNGIHTLIALDPAADTPLLGGGQYAGFNDSGFKFSDVAANSYAFHSSNLGSGTRAKTAEYAFDLQVPEGYESGARLTNNLEQYAEQLNAGIIIGITDEIGDALREHGFAVSLFSELLLRQKLNPSDPTAQLFSPANLQSNEAEFLKRDGYDGLFAIDPGTYVNELGLEAGQQTWKARAFGFSSKDQAGNAIINPRTL